MQSPTKNFLDISAAHQVKEFALPSLEEVLVAMDWIEK